MIYLICVNLLTLFISLRKTFFIAFYDIRFYVQNYAVGID